MEPREMIEVEHLRANEPVSVADAGRRRYWWFRERFCGRTTGLEAADMMALVYEREQRWRRRLERAHALMMALVHEREQRGRRRLERAHALMAREEERRLRTAIPVEVKRVVRELCGGRCVECPGDALLEFDHVIPLAMGGSSTQRNLRLLFADCNRAKGAAL